MWKGIETLLCSGRDELQIFDLSTKSATLTQGNNTIEHFYGQLNTLWKEIDRRMPNSMECSKDITTFNNYIQRQQVYQFLVGINDSLDKEKRDLLHQELFPTVEVAYATIRRELARRGIMVGAPSFGKHPSGIGCGLAAKNWSEKSSYRRED